MPGYVTLHQACNSSCQENFNTACLNTSFVLTTGSFIFSPEKYML